MIFRCISEEPLLGFYISPIRKRHYLFIFVRTQEQLLLYMGSHDTKELVQFLNECVPQHISISYFLDAIYPSEHFLSAYKSKFLKLSAVTDKNLEALFEPAYRTDLSVPNDRGFGLDGFSLTCYNYMQQKKADIYCTRHSVHYKHVKALANKLLDLAKADSTSRFLLY